MSRVHWPGQTPGDCWRRKVAWHRGERHWRLPAAGELSDDRPLRALDAAMRRFRPDQLVIA